MAIIHIHNSGIPLQGQGLYLFEIWFESGSLDYKLTRRNTESSVKSTSFNRYNGNSE